MKYLHTMIRVSDLDATVRFFDLLGLREVRRIDNEGGRFTLVFLTAPGDEAAQVELTHNWDPKPIRAGATSATSPTPSMISTHPARGCFQAA